MNENINRKRICIFVAITLCFSIAISIVIYLNGGIFAQFPYTLRPQALALMSLLMGTPAIANIATRLITREGWSNMLLRPNFRRGWPFYLAAMFLPALATIVGGVVYYLLFPERFDPSMTYAREALGLVPIIKVKGPLMHILTMALLFIPMSLPTLFLPFGEEFGWRAYLLPKLMPLGSRKAVVLVGVIWAVWHWPYVFMGYEYGFDYWGIPVVGPMMWIVICCLLGTFLTWVTLRSGSVWPAAIAHGLINANAALMVYFIRDEPDHLIGPSPVGIIGSLGYAILALLIWFHPRALTPITNQHPVETKTDGAVTHGSVA